MLPEIKRSLEGKMLGDQGTSIINYCDGGLTISDCPGEFIKKMNHSRL